MKSFSARGLLALACLTASLAPAHAQVVDEHRTACEAEANARRFKGAEFDKYVSDCLDKRVDARMTLASVPGEKLEGCKRAASAMRMQGDKRRDFVVKCASRQPESAGSSVVPNEKMQACKREANARRYKGKAFDDYVSGCTTPLEL